MLGMSGPLFVSCCVICRRELRGWTCWPCRRVAWLAAQPRQLGLDL
jgi:hypothetical protein